MYLFQVFRDLNNIFAQKFPNNPKNIKMIWSAVFYICGQLELNKISKLY